MKLDREYCEAAGYVFEQSQGRVLHSSEEAIVADAGLAGQRIDDIANGIWRSLETAASSEARTSAYWALGKLARREDKERFVAALASEAGRDMQCAYQVMIALANMGEQVFTRSSISHNEDDLNRADALAYLATRSI